MDTKLKKAIELFIDARLEDIGAEGSTEVDAAISTVGRCIDALSAVGVDARLIGTLEDALSLQTGEELRYYYKCGFSDAIGFIMNWGAKL